jgi:hypothetical protein
VKSLANQLPARIIQLAFMPLFNHEEGNEVCCTTGFEMLFEETTAVFFCDTTTGLLVAFVLTAGLII